MNKYNVIFTSTFNQMFHNKLNNYKYYSDTYCNKIENKVYETIHLLKNFPYSAPLIKYMGV